MNEPSDDLFAQAPFGLCILSLEGHLQRCNPAFERMLGEGEQELQGWCLSDDLSWLRSLLAGDRLSYHLNKNLGSLWAEVTVSLLRDVGGQPIGLMAKVEDRSRQRQTDDNVNYREVFESIPDGFARFSPDGRIRFLNTAMARILKHESRQCLHRTLAELKQPVEVNHHWSDLLERVLALGRPILQECRLGDETYYCRFVPDADGISVLVYDMVALRDAYYEQRLLRADRLDAVGQLLAEAGLDGHKAMHGIAEYAGRYIGGTCFCTVLSADRLNLMPIAVYDVDAERCAWAQALLEKAPFRAQGPVFSQVIPSGKALLIPKVPAEFLRQVLRPEHLALARDYPIQSLLAVPMRARNQTVGAITLVSSIPDKPYDQEDQALLQELADRAALTLTSARLYEENLAQAAMLERANQQLEELVRERTRELMDANTLLQQQATHDSLTGLANRREFDQVIETELRRARRGGRWLSLLMLDIDCFKRYNDTLGHLAGDDCLRQVAQCLRACFQRGSDRVARYGGEEFAVILPEMHSEQAQRMAEEVRAAVQNLKLPHPDSPVSGWVTVSIGVFSGQVGAESTAAHFIQCADEALYASKSNGRNRVTGYCGQLPVA